MVEKSAPVKDQLVGLDTLRFAAAAWVAASHGARLPLDKLLPADGFVAKVVVALNNGIFNGSAAVLLFFVISGFVIHRPHVGRDTLDQRSFYMRRLVRIVPPTVIIQVVCWAAGPAYADKLNQVMWSLYCEIAYYILYPALFILFRRGLTRVAFLASTVVALAIIGATWPTLYYWEFSMPTMILVGLPNWILGCVLAEARARARDIPANPGRTIWIWRLGAVALSAALKIPVTHGPIVIGNPASLWLFAIYCYFWIGHELDYFRSKPAWNVLELCGAASFSLYMVHNPVIGFFDTAFVRDDAFSSEIVTKIAIWAIELASIAAATYVFYKLVEAPFHRLARRLGGRPVDNRRPIEQLSS